MNAMYWQARGDASTPVRGGVSRRGDFAPILALGRKQAVNHLKALLIVALTSLCLFPWDCLAAAPSHDLRTELVRFADLDLTRPTGVLVLYRQAARDVCEPDGAAGRLAGDRECRSSAIARAVAEVGAPLLTEHHRALTHPANLQVDEAHLE
jgi:UrcA family protein